MGKIKQKKINIEVFNTGTLIKQDDHKFDGNHPNGIYTGYTAKGIISTEPTIGERCNVGTLSTSPVTEILKDDGKTCTFKTLNSTYKLIRE